MADADRRLDLEPALLDLGAAIAWPTSTPSTAGLPDLAARVRARIEAMPVPSSVPAWRRAFGGRPIRRGLVLALVVLLVLAAVAGAAVLGLPGLRIGFGPAPSVVPSISIPPSSAPGAFLGLGDQVGLDEAAGLIGFEPRLPTDPALGDPTGVWVRDGRLSLVYAPTDAYPASEDSRIGLLLTQFRGDVDPGYYDKVIRDTSTLEPVTVNSQPGYWISGPPHYFFYTDANGVVVDETRRKVGDVLLWAEDGITYRMESGIGRDATIALAEGMR